MSDKCNITFGLNVVDAFCVIGSNVTHLLWRSHFDYFLGSPLEAAVNGVQLRNILDGPDSHILVLMQVLPLQVGEGGGGGDRGRGGEGGGGGHASPLVSSSSSTFPLLHAAIV